MTGEIQSGPTNEEVEKRYAQMKKDAESNGYCFNPDIEFAKSLIKAILVNEKRYGYGACPCRLSFGKKNDDLDIICPCDYRDPDLTQYGACYCALYVSREIFEGKKQAKSIPERRPNRSEREKKKSEAKESGKMGENKLSYPVYRCKVCGYLCARDEPPDICPVCKAKKERFELFIAKE